MVLATYQKGREKGASWAGPIHKERWYYVFCGNEYNIWNSTKALMHLTRSGVHIIAQCRGDILPKFQRQFKALKEKEELSINKRASNRDILQTLVYYDAEVISTYFLSRKMRKLSGTYSYESNWFGYPVEDNIEG